jgi:hypothetical protein
MNGDEDREHQLEQENAELRSVIAALRHEIADLRASALMWRKLYEDAIQRHAEREPPSSGANG